MTATLLFLPPMPPSSGRALVAGLCAWLLLLALGGVL